MKEALFTDAVLEWYARGHRDLPWRHTRDAYRIWISEIMLQQTRAETVAGYYERFIRDFPDVRALARAAEQDVLKRWEGLGYYSRARNLQAAARIVCEKYGGEFPRTAQALEELPGIGAYTAGAVAAIAYGECVAAVDGNVERVVARYYGIREDITRTDVKRDIRVKAQALVPREAGEKPGAFANAMMELGATVCTPQKAACLLCPVREGCRAWAEGITDRLPVKRKAKAQRVENRAVALVFSKGGVLMRKREEKLLNGLYVFPDYENISRVDALAQALEAQTGLKVAYDGSLGHARHVFTHKIWEMELHAFVAEEQRPVEGYIWVDAAQLEAIPVPTAVAAARRAAMQRLHARA